MEGTDPEGREKGSDVESRDIVLHGLRSKSFLWKQTSHKQQQKTTRDLFFSTRRVDTHKANWMEDK